MAHFWFAFDVGAYEDSTAHLTMLQDGAYNRLLRHYYKTAKPIPEESAQIIRISGAHSVEEIEAVTYILKEFFRLKSDGYHNIRADKELLKSKQLSKLRAISAKRRWDDKRHAKPMQLHNSTDAKADTVTVTVTTTEPKSKAKAIRAHFSIPSLGEITAYCEERNRGVNPQDWFNYYSARGWKYKGGVAMSDWRAAVRTWEKDGNGRINPNRPEPTRPVSAQVARFHNNLAEVQRTFGAAASMGGTVDSSSPRQTPRLSTGDSTALEGEVAGIQKLGN